MRPTFPRPTLPSPLLVLLVPGVLALPGGTLGAPAPQRSRSPATAIGTLAQLPGADGCLADRSAKPRRGGCTRVRALRGPGPFLGSRAVAVSPDGLNVYVASSGSTVDVFDRDRTGGALLQKPRRAGCVTASALPDCTHGRALGEVSSVAVSPDGRHVYATAFASDAVSVFKRVTRTRRGG